MSADAYLIGRRLGNLQAPYLGEDEIFAAKRLDGQNLQQGTFRHCTFANISFKEATLKGFRFEDCVFISCYFRRARLEECHFLGCRFFNCDFPRMVIVHCDFRYSKFEGCFVPYSDIELSLPPEPNLREELVKNLAVQAAALGSPKDTRAFRMCEIRAWEEHLRFAVVGKSEWYQKHYDPQRRVSAAFSLAASFLNRRLWGYGEKARVLVYNFLILGLGCFPALFYLTRDKLTKKPGGSVGFTDTLFYSLKNLIPSGIDSDIIATASLTRFLAGLESVLGLIIAGLFVSYLFRWILDQ